jgi:hypothetical protein
MDTSTKTSISARAKINNALRDGKLKKPSCCDGCGKETSELEAHHPKGDKHPEVIVWICTTCHGDAHAGREKRAVDGPWTKAAKDMEIGRRRKRERRLGGHPDAEHETETM